jgi:hypothetical protein
MKESFQSNAMVVRQGISLAHLGQISEIFERNQRVYVDGKLSRSAELKAVGFHRAPFCALYWSSYIYYDLPGAINNMPLLFADDLSIIGTIESIATTTVNHF